MKYSIVIPVYNIEKYVSDAIKSCLRQQCKSDYEVIIVNDGSNDGSASVIESFLYDPRIVYINKANGGLSSARNAGMSVAKGDYILFLDGDDWLADDALSVLDKTVGDADIIVFPMMYTYPDGTRKKADYSAVYGILDANCFLSISMRNRIFNIIPAQNKVYKREFLQQNNILFIDGILHEDNPFFFDIVMSASVIKTIENPIYYYRQNRPGAITSSCSIKNFEGVIKGNSHILEKTGENNKAVNFFILTVLLFQAINKYKSKADLDLVIRYFHKIEVKRSILRRMFYSYFRLNTYVLLLILLISPELLRTLLRR